MQHGIDNGQPTTSGFAKLGGGVTTQTAAGAKTASDNPDGVELNPQLRKAASPLVAMRARPSLCELPKEKTNL